MDTSELIPKLESKVPGSVQEVRPFGRGGEISLWIDIKTIQQVAQAVCNEPGFTLDWLENISVFEAEKALMITYFVRSRSKEHTLYLRASVPLTSPDEIVDVQSIVRTWPMGKLMEYEAADLFGIRFVGNPLPAPQGKRFLLPKGWYGYPLRKSYVFPTEFLDIPHARPAGHTEPDEYGVVS